MAGEMSNTIIEVWMRMYEEQVRHARHHEALRAQSTNVIVAISAAVLAFFASGHVSDARQYSVGVFLIIINAYGLLMSMKHYERSRLHVTVGSQYRTALSAQTSLNGLEINRARSVGRQAHARTFRVTRAIRAYILWCGLHIMLGLTGLAILVVK
jgi:hypothetical protein